MSLRDCDAPCRREGVKGGWRGFSECLTSVATVLQWARHLQSEIQTNGVAGLRLGAAQRLEAVRRIL